MPQTFSALNLGGTADGLLVLSNGRFFRGKLRGAPVEATGEVIFNTSMTGYQEILTDPSYAGQIVTMTYPHILATTALILMIWNQKQYMHQHL